MCVCVNTCSRCIYIYMLSHTHTHTHTHTHSDDWKQGRGFVTADMISEHLPSAAKDSMVRACACVCVCFYMCLCVCFCMRLCVCFSRCVSVCV
jgi:hypothetical protein